MSVDEQVQKRLADVSDKHAKDSDQFFQWVKEARDMRNKELEYEVDRFRQTQLRDGIMSAEDVRTLLGSFYTSLQQAVMANARTQSAGAVEHVASLCGDAAKRGAELDVPQISGALTAPQLGFLSKDPLKKPKKLAALGATSAEEGKLKESLAKAQRENLKINGKIERITAQFHDMIEQKSTVGADLNEKKEEVKKCGGMDSPDPSVARELQDKIKGAQDECQKARKMLEEMLDESPQYKTLKTMMDKKQEELKIARSDLQEHELVFSGGADDV